MKDVGLNGTSHVGKENRFVGKNYEYAELKNVKEYSTDIFYYDAQSEIFFAQVSDFVNDDFELSRLGMNTDEGFYLHNPATGNKVLMVLSEVKTDRGTVASWTFKPNKKIVNKEFIVTVFNN